MKPVNISSCAGFDLSITKQEAQNEMTFLEKEICKYFTDDFRCWVSVPMAADAMLTIKPREGKVQVIEQMMGRADPDNIERIRWRHFVLSIFKRKIEEDYGTKPFKEANDIISKIKLRSDVMPKKDDSFVNLPRNMQAIAKGITQYLNERGISTDPSNIEFVTDHAPKRTRHKNTVVSISLKGCKNDADRVTRIFDEFKKRGFDHAMFVDSNTLKLKYKGHEFFSRGEQHRTKPDHVVFKYKKIQ